MDAATTSGLNTTVVGIGTVFFALTMLVGVLTVMIRILSPAKDTAAGAADGGSADADSPAEPAQTDGLLARVALAAYGLHAASRTAVRPPQPSSAWARAARSRQILRFERSQLRR